MGINTNGLALGSSLPAQSSFQARTPGSAANQVSDEHKADSDQGSQTGNSTGTDAPSYDGDAGSAGSSGSAAASSGANGTSGTTSGTRPTGPSAQTRSAQAAQSQGNARTTGARSNAAGSTGSQNGAETAAASDDATSDFGSVMASALGRSAGNAPDQSAQSKTADSGDATTAAKNAPQAAAPDATAWIAQVLMPSTAPQTITTAAGAADTAASNALPAQLGAQNALRARLNADPSPQTSGPAAGATTAQTGDAQTATAAAGSAATPGDINALASVQQLISGLTGANSADTSTGAAAATPTAHATTADSTDASQAAAALQLSSLSQPNASLGNTTLSIHSSVGSAAFADDVSSSVMGLAQSGITQAQLQLNPADLGPVQVHITMQSGQASVWFGAAHSDTRAALEQSLPRLREMFAGAGMPLTDSGVFREPPQQQQAQSSPMPGSPRAFAGDTAVTATVTQVANIRLALLDTYA